VQDRALALQIAQHDHAAFELLMRRHNTRLFRAARAILKDDAEAEDALQDAYLEAYRHIGEFRGDSQLSTWLTRIVITRALMRLRKEKRHRNVISIDSRETPEGERLEADVEDETAEPPVETVWRGELRKVIESRIDDLPLPFRTVFVLREIEDMTAAETAEALGIPEATVRSRHFRARAMLRASIARDVDVASADAFSFDGERCDRIVGNVLARLRIE
jgi:RNA polymerase sigma-70 factor, ECF subfamily